MPQYAVLTPTKSCYYKRFWNIKLTDTSFTLVAQDALELLPIFWKFLIFACFYEESNECSNLGKNEFNTFLFIIVLFVAQCSPGWLRTCMEPHIDLKLAIFLPSPPDCWDYWHTLSLSAHKGINLNPGTLNWSRWNILTLKHQVAIFRTIFSMIHFQSHKYKFLLLLNQHCVFSIHHVWKTMNLAVRLFV